MASCKEERLLKKALKFWYVSDNEKSLSYFNKLIEEFPNTSYFYYYRGRVKYWTFGAKDAIEDYNKAIDISQYTEYYYYRAIAYSQIDCDEEAIKDLTIALKNEPNNHFYLHTRAMIYFKLKQYKLSRIDYQKAIKVLSHKESKTDFLIKSYSYNGCGWCYYYEKHYDDARIYFQRALEINITLEDAKIGLKQSKDKCTGYFRIYT